jgi:flavin-dependent dehydrogenase
MGGSMRTEVLVIGGGPSGAMAGLLLARAGRSVVLLEKARFPRRKVCGEFIAAAGLHLLSRLGLGEPVAALSGPAVHRIALWTDTAEHEAAMPALDAATPFPRALEREALDELLLEHAGRAGAQVMQPCSALSLVRTRSGFVCRAAERRGAAEMQIEARAVIAAHGSWEPGALSTQPPRLAAHPEDLLGLQAHLAGADLPPGRIVLAPFPGGYAGLVERAEGRSTLACCVRRDALERARAAHPGVPAGEALLLDLLGRNALLEKTLRHGAREGAWLAAGPLRPGRRPLVQDGVFVVGNAAGEAHPVVGEGIGLALQSSALLGPMLARALEEGYSALAARRVGLAYAWRWRRLAALRLWISARFAALAMHPCASRRAHVLLGRAPALLTLSARLSGKSSGTIERLVQASAVGATARTSPG